MKLIVPRTVAPANLTTTNISETPPAAYNAGTTYALGDQVSVFTGTLAAVYESLQAGNIGHTPGSSPTWWTSIGETYAVYDGGTAYALADRVIYGHRVYESLEAANTGNQPDISPTKWLDTGATNRWRLFDNVVTAQAQRPGSITLTLEMGVLVNALALFNLAGGTVQAVMTDPEAGEVYNQTINLVDNSAVEDWYSYFYSDVEQAEKATFLDLPAFPNAEIAITITAGDGVAACGEAVLGTLATIGDTNWGTSVGITDFSRKEQDDFGNFVIVERPFADRVEYDLTIDTAKIAAAKKLLTRLRATPAVFIGAEYREETIVYGFYKSWNIVIAGPVISDCSVEVEGLT